MGWLIVIFLFVVVISYLLFAPFYIEIDTERQIFRFRFHTWLELRLMASLNTLYIVLKIFGWKRSWDVFSQKPPQNNKVRARKSSGLKISKYRIIAFFKSFKLRRFQLSLDTGDMPTNGLLFPLFYLIKARTQLDISINFKNTNTFILLIENNLARLTGALIFAKSNKPINT